MSGSDQAWKVGALAKATGLTVRALHHYDHIGPATASPRRARIPPPPDAASPAQSTAAPAPRPPPRSPRPARPPAMMRRSKPTPPAQVCAPRHRPPPSGTADTTRDDSVTKPRPPRPSEHDHPGRPNARSYAPASPPFQQSGPERRACRPKPGKHRAGSRHPTAPANAAPSMPRRRSRTRERPLAATAETQNQAQAPAFTRSANAAHVPAAKARTDPSGSLLSRIATSGAALPTSTQLPPLFPE